MNEELFRSEFAWEEKYWSGAMAEKENLPVL